MTVLLIVGPGAHRRHALAASEAENYPSLNVLWVRYLDADAARRVVAWDMHAQARWRLAVINLDGAAEAPQHILLKTLEEPTARFVLTAEHPPLATIVSRSRVQHLPAAAHEPTEEETAAAARVSLALRAVSRHDLAALTRAMRGWDEDAYQALRDWAAQCAAGRFRAPLAMPAGTAFGPRFGERLLVELGRASFPRVIRRKVSDQVPLGPKLAAQAALAEVMGRSP